MALSFTLVPAQENRKKARHDESGKRRVLVTGAAGRIGSYFAEHTFRHYNLRLMIAEGEDAEAIERFGEVVTADLLDLERMKVIFQGIDTVVHLAADPSPSATWESVVGANITGTYHMFVAAKAAGSRRVIHASSIHAVSGYPTDMQVKTSDPVNPGDLYGVSKCFGEAMSRYMAEKHDLSAITVRIGAFQPREAGADPDNSTMLDAFVSRRDLVQLLTRAIEADHLQFAIFNGVSDNRFKRLDITDARQLLGYAPQDDLAKENPQFTGVDLGHIHPSPRPEPADQAGIREDL
jgi:nucleoside-diphosphate-sugar epimerase